MRFFVSAVALLSVIFVSAKEIRDTVWTRQNDKIILTYNVSSDNGHLSLDFSRPRIIPSSALYEACKGEIDKLKVVLFDRIGDFGRAKWAGISPTAFMVPSGLSYDKTSDGYYILGESQPIEFHNPGNNKVVLKLPLYIAVYEKKQNYRIVSSSKQPLNIPTYLNRSGRKGSGRQDPETERIAVTSSEELEAENDDIIRALSSIELVKELLEQEVEYPLSTNMQMEMSNLRSLRNQIKDPDVIEKINNTLILCTDKERELKEAQNQSALAAKAEEQALLQQQKQEAEAQQKEAEEKAQLQEEKQQKRTLWMIIGGVILAILGFIGNAVFKHFRDIRNQKSIMQMQESLARQAEHEAGRRAREMVRNKAHQVANKGRNRLRESMNDINKQPKNSNRRSI